VPTCYRHLIALELQHDLQRRRYLGYVLPAFGGALEQPGQVVPGELGAILSRQMLLYQRAYVGERLECQQVGDDERPRQWARPIGTGHSTISRDTKGLTERYALTAESRV
jgi:hypothetical protein